jgi:hypothetical protein
MAIMNSNKKTKNKKVNEAISNMGNSGTLEGLNDETNKAKVKKNNHEILK